MSWSFPIGRLFGSELRVHVTFFLLLAWVGYAAYVQAGPQAALVNIAFVLCLFACVIAHEYGHALTARRYGIATPDITLLPIGGLARLERMPENPRHEIVVALAGPAVNIVIWAVLALFFGAHLSPDLLTGGEITASSFFAAIAMINLILALFNLIPAFPMDGGRVLRALLSMRMDRVRATRAAAHAGQFVALLLGFWGLSGGNPVLVLIAVFVFVAANAESNDVAMRAVARRVLAREAMITAYESLLPSDSVDAAGAALIRTTQHEFPVLDQAGALLGFVTRNAIFAARHEDGPNPHSVAEIMQSEIPRVGLMAGLEKVLEALGKGAPAVAICAKDGQMIGYITRENIGEFMVLKGQ